MMVYDIQYQLIIVVGKFFDAWITAAGKCALLVYVVGIVGAMGLSAQSPQSPKHFFGVHGEM
jgi:hypothetical protein